MQADHTVPEASPESIPGTGRRRLLPLSLPWLRGENLGQRIFRTRAMDTLPRIITHERIYILPSRRGWMFVLSLMVMLIASINYNLSLGYALSFLLTGLFTAALIATYRNLAGVHITALESAEAESGTPLPFAVTLHNPSANARQGIDIGNHQVTHRIDLPATEPATMNLPLPTSKRGLQPCGRLTVTSDYPVGLWFTWSYIHVACDGLVLPKPEPNPPPLPGGTKKRPEGQSLKANQGEFSSLKAYQPGDSPGSIAWKAAARGLGLYTREFVAEERSSEITLYWEDTQGLEHREQRISRLAAWVKSASAQDLQFALELPGARLPMGQGSMHAKAALRLLALY